MYVAVFLVVGVVGFVGWASTSDSREARVYRRKWKEFKLRKKSRNTSKCASSALDRSGRRARMTAVERRYQGTAAGSGSSAKDKRIG